jgi:hypothetical protein
LKRGKKKRAIPNPNKRFMSLGEALTQGKPIPKVRAQIEPIVVDSKESEGVESEASLRENSVESESL